MNRFETIRNGLQPRADSLSNLVMRSYISSFDIDLKLQVQAK